MPNTPGRVLKGETFAKIFQILVYLPHTKIKFALITYGNEKIFPPFSPIFCSL